MEKIHVGFDLDGVLIDHTDLKIKLARALGYNLKPEQTPSDVILEFLPRNVYKEIQRGLFEDLDTSCQSPLMLGAHYVLDKLKTRAVPFTLISRRRNSEIAKKVLAHHGLWDTYFTDTNACFVSSIEDKNTIASDLGISHFIDDEMRVLRSLTAVPNKYLMDPLEINSLVGQYTSIHALADFLDFLK